MISLKEFKKHNDWVKVWSGRWSFLFDSYQGCWWTSNKVFQNKAAYKQVVYFYSDGITDCWVSGQDKDSFGQILIEESKKTRKYFDRISKLLLVHGKKVNKFLTAHKAPNLNLKTFDEYWDILGKYFNYHINVKYVVDYLTPKQMGMYLPILEKARLKVEMVPRHAEDFMQDFAAHFAKNSDYPKELLLCATGKELRQYFLTKKLPPITELNKRLTGGVILFNKNTSKVFVGKKTQQTKSVIEGRLNAKEIKGQVAYKGKASGRVKIIYNPKIEAEKFNSGDILVTGMTRPEYLPIMHQAAAFVTDAGGILSHAAITAREMKKPCVIGTKIATKVFNDGDIIEVDANKGIIRKIK